MRRLLPASLLVATLALTGCVASEADQLAASARATVARLQELPEEERLAAALDLAAQSEAGARAALGVDDALGGTAASDAIFGELHAMLDERIDVTGPATDFVPASFAMPSGGDPVGTFIGIGFVAIGWLGESGMNAADRGDVGSEVNEGDDSRTEATIAENGDVNVSYTTEMSANGATAAISAATELKPCPDADGRLELTGSTTVRFRTANVSLEISMEITARATLSDDAEYASSDHEYRFQTASTIDGKGEFFDHTATSGGELTVNRSSSNATLDFQQRAVDGAAAMAEIVAADLYRNAKLGWESGRCVTVDVTADADAENLQPGSETEIEVSPRSTRDGKPTGGSVVTTMSGQGSLDRDGDKVAAVATYRYTASDEKNSFGTLTVESRSKRGIGKTTFSVGTGGRAYTAVGSDGEFTGTGTICSLTETFTFAGSGLEFTFFPADKDGGTFQLTGAHDGVSFVGDGTYTVQWADASLASSLIIDGDVVLSTSEGVTTTSPADMTVTLTPTEACD